MPEQTQVTRVLIAWANLYISLRSVAPTLADIQRATVEYGVQNAIGLMFANMTNWFGNIYAQVRSVVRAPANGRVA